MDFPHDFDSNSNIFLDAIQDFQSAHETLDSEPITFIGCYPKLSIVSKAILYFKSRVSARYMTSWLNHQKGISRLNEIHGKKIWVTFENRRIPWQGADLTVSFDLDTNHGKNLYFPLLLSYIDFLGKSPSYAKHQITFEELKQNRLDIGKPLSERKFACAFINNPDPVRLRFINELSKYGKVDIFGRYSGNYVNNKVQIGNDYKLAICFENDLYPGYVTEKPLEAWLSRSVPIYWGLDSKEILNNDAIVNLATMNSVEESAILVADLAKNLPLLEKMIKAPLINEKFIKPELSKFLGQIFS